MKTETLFEKPQFGDVGDAFKQQLRSKGARARDAALSMIPGMNKAKGRLSMRIITDHLLKDFMAYVGSHDIHPITDDTVRDYIGRHYGKQLSDVEPIIQQVAGGAPPAPPGDDTEFDQYTMGTGDSNRRQGDRRQGDRRQPQPTPPDDEFDQYTQGTGQQPTPPDDEFDQYTQGTGQPQPTPPDDEFDQYTQGTGQPPAQQQPAPTTKQTSTNNTAANIASTRQSTNDEMRRYQTLLGQIQRAVMNPTPDPQFMNKITALLQTASGSNNLRTFAKQKIDELKARPDVTDRYPEIANIGDDPFANLPRGRAASAPTTPAQPAAPATSNTITGAMQGAAQAMGNNFYDMLWNKLSQGDVTEGGRPSAVLQAAKQALDDGTIKSRHDFETWAQAWGQQRQQQQQQRPSPAPAAAPTDEFDQHTQGTAPTPAAQPQTVAAPAGANSAGGWRSVRPDEVFPPGRQYRMNQTTGQSDVYEPFERQRRTPEGRIGPNESKAIVERWWVMAAINNALQTTQRGTPPRREMIASLRNLQRDARVMEKIPQLKQVPLESHHRVFNLAVFLVENQITDKTAVRKAYQRIIVEDITLNRQQIDQIFKALAKTLSLQGLAHTERKGKRGTQQSGDTGMGNGSGRKRVTKTTVITPSMLQFAEKHVTIKRADYNRLIQAVGKNGAKVEDIYRALRGHVSNEQDIEDIIQQAVEYGRP